MKKVASIFARLALFTSLSLMTWQSATAAAAVTSLRKITAVVVLPGASGHYFSAARGGIFSSKDSGKTWQLSYKADLPITMLETANNGELYAFVVTRGLLTWDGTSAKWQELGNEFGTQVLTQISSDAEQNTLLATNQFGQIIRSVDGGKSWQRTAGIRSPETRAEKHGQQLFNTYCQSCHGKKGTGETYTLKSLTTKGYIMAPPLNDFAHAWHHTDEGLAKTILKGSPRKNRMIAWKGVLKTEDALDIVAYMKTLWEKWALDCQGPKHMQCM